MTGCTLTRHFLCDIGDVPCNTVEKSTMPHHMPQGAANHSAPANDPFANSLLASLQSVPSHQGAAWTLTSDTHFRIAVLVCSSVLAVMLVLRLLYLRKRAKEGRLYHRLDSEVEGQKDRESLLRTRLDGFEEEDFETHIGGLDVPLLQEVCIEQINEMEPRPQFLLRKPMQITRI